MEKWHAAGREAHFEVNMYKTHQLRTTFGYFWKSGCRTENGTPLWRVARLEVKTLKKLTCSEHFWTLRCGKIACRCGAKHMWQSKRTRHLRFGALGGSDVAKMSDRRDQLASQSGTVSQSVSWLTGQSVK